MMVKDLEIRVMFAKLLDDHDAGDLVQILAETMDDYGKVIARRSGQYDRAAALDVIAKHLHGLDVFIANYDPTEA